MWGAQESHAVLTRALGLLQCVWLHLSEPLFPFCTMGTVQVLFPSFCCCSWLCLARKPPHWLQALRITGRK